MNGRLLSRGGLFIGLPLLLWLTLELVGYDPDPLRLTLLVALVVGALAVMMRTIEIDEVPWPADVDRSGPADHGADQRLLRYLRAIENHHDSRHVDSALIRALAVLARARLERHDVALGDARSRELLGERLVSALCDPTPARLSLSDIDRCLQRIEKL